MRVRSITRVLSTAILLAVFSATFASAAICYKSLIQAARPSSPFQTFLGQGETYSACIQDRNSTIIQLLNSGYTSFIVEDCQFVSNIGCVATLEPVIKPPVLQVPGGY